MKYYMLRRWLACGLVLLLGLAWGRSASAQGISGTIHNVSVWKNLMPPSGLGPPPGDGSGSGKILVSVNSLDASLDSQSFVGGVLPLGPGPYSFNFPGPFSEGSYVVVAWVDGNSNGVYDVGEPKGSVGVAIKASGGSVGGKLITISDDSDNDELPDWWEAHWFKDEVDPLGFSGAADPDGDGLSNLEEYRFSVLGTNGVFKLALLNPAKWDTDDDGMDDGWECRYYDPIRFTGMNATEANKTNDFDGDGLSDWQEYCGIDGFSRMVFDRFVGYVEKGKLNPQALVSDDLNPIDVDSDFDMLLDSFEAAWYDPVNRIDPRVGAMSEIPTVGSGVDMSIAREDSDQDGLSNYREQCLLSQLHQSTTNGWMWNWRGRVPFIFSTYGFQGKTYRICTMQSCGGQALSLNLVMDGTIPDPTNRFMLRNPDPTQDEWTDPTEGTGYIYVDEDIPPGHDTDNDGLPDGWEVQFGLNPRDDGFGGGWDHGPFGDMDNDGVMNIDEFFGQDGNRSATFPYINGTGDETNPNRYNWRPDSTYQWRWINTNVTATTDASEREMGLPEGGTGVSRLETLGSASPTTSLGGTNYDNGTDTDDDGISDAVEISPTNSVLPSSPVDSCDPFIPRSALIISSSGIAIPDPEPEPVGSSAGWRPDLQRRDWTLECQVKLLGTNLTGNLFNFQTVRGPKVCTVYRLSLSNNAPMLVSDNSSYTPVIVSANPLPTNRWVHLAATWDHKNNSLSLYVDGVLSMSPLQLTESFSVYMQPASNHLMLAESPDGSFINKLLLDEVRIWGLARTPKQIAEYAHKLVPSVNGDDVWIHGTEFDTILVHGGGIFNREPGVPLTNVYEKSGSYWLDDGDGQYDAPRDTLLLKGSNVMSGMTGAKVDKVYWNDKDNSGDFTRNCLLAYYRFDDGGSTAEDFARRAKNGLLGATAEEFRFGDRGYALPTNSFLFVTNDAAKVYGVDQRGADDSDFDGLPDAWEIIHGMDPWDDGTRGESLPGTKDGANGAKGDPDGDGLINIYEYWSGTNPHAEDSDGNGILDSQEDRDGDGVVNITEQLLGCRPDLVDTDDDGLADSEEQSSGTSPINAVDPATNSQAIVFGGGGGNYLEVPSDINQRLRDWTIEAWVRPSNAMVGTGVIMRRVVENMAGGTQAVNFAMGLETNGVGGLRLYAGYVWPDGKQYIVRAGVVPPAVWTHLAASYNRSSSTLILYTNGAVAASANTFNRDPPVSGRGGDVYVRIGEGVVGAIDEVRLWSKARTGIQIQSNTNRVIAASDTNGLINYFRFDDGEASTNSNHPSWTEFHQPAGFQDFTYANDWNEQWRHAAIKHGNVGTIRPGAIVSPPSLRVMLQPDEAILGGAQWTLDGGTWQDSGVSLQGLDAGTHVVMFKDVAGWTTPASLLISLTNGRAMTTNGLYVQKSALKISFNNVPIPPLAAWKVNGGDWLTNGVTLTNLDAGANFVSYQPVPGYVEPPSETVTLSAGQTLSLTRPYTIMTASISAIITPAAAADAGARWQIANYTGLVSGAVAGGLAMTTHQVQFGNLDRWIAPASISVTPTNQVTVVVTGLYSQVTGLAVDLFPDEAVATGAQWRISGRDWTNNGVFLPLSVGSYIVEFKPLSARWLAPGSRSVSVTNQQVTELSVSYLKADVFGGGFTTNAGDFSSPWALDLDAQHRLYVADTYNNRVQRYDSLLQQWTVYGGPRGTGTNQFDTPSGIAVDKNENVFVADQGNHRIQKLGVAKTNWVSIGTSPLVAGSALGQFNAPSDVAVDSALNLYVADTWNNRVQKMSTSLVWSVFVSNGITPGKVQYPQGLFVDSSDNLYVSDDLDLTNGLNRVQKFSKTGAFVALLGGRDSTQGGLQKPGGMSIGNNNLFIASSFDNRVAYSGMTGMTWTTLVESNVLSHPEDVEWDPRGYLYIADTSHNRILMVQVDPAAATNGLTQLMAMTSTGTNTSFTLTWFARLNWNYAVQYANSLTPGMVWVNLPGYSAVTGFDMITNCTDSTVLGITNRFYRIIAY